MMNFNLLGDIIKQIRQFYYLRLNLHTQHAVTGYVILSIIVLPLTLVTLILRVFLETIFKAWYILKEFPNAIFYTKKKNLIEKL